jgi:glycerophosphoryl diester phosphodiesterase
MRTARRNGYPSIGVILEKWRQRHLETVRAMHPEFFFCDADDLPRWGNLRIKDAQLAVYEITDARTAANLARRGADLIETFAIGEMLAEFELLRTAPA